MCSEYYAPSVHNWAEISAAASAEWRLFEKVYAWWPCTNYEMQWLRDYTIFINRPIVAVASEPAINVNVQVNVDHLHVEQMH